MLSDLKWGDFTWNWGLNGDFCSDQFGNSNVIQRIRLQCSRDLTLDGPGVYSCNGCQKLITVDPMFSRLIDWTLADLKERLDVCYPMLGWSVEDIQNFFDCEPLMGRVTLVQKLRRNRNELQFLKDDNSRLFTKDQRCRDALENSVAEARKFEKFYNDLLDLSRKHMECPVCHLNPWCLVLRCGHTLCQSCADMLKVEDDKIKCGMCSRPDIYMIALSVRTFLI